MHIILVPDRVATARTLNVTPRMILAIVAGFIAFLLATSFLISWIGVRFKLPFATEIVATVQQVQNRKNEDYVRDNISSMAVKLGEMQAQLIRLDSMSEHLARLSGINAPKDSVADDKRVSGGKAGKGGQGGPLIVASPPLAANELQREIDRLAEQIDLRSEALTALESQFMERRIRSTLLPTLLPIDSNRIGSTYGRRVDPIAGIGAMHEGIDFVADSGTTVTASAGGVVVSAEFHPQYGNLIEIDHGNDFSSRYAHLSKIKVKPGQIVKRGQIIAASGNTGRSTGPHLHFEVRYKGVAQNPARFLQQGTQLALNLADVTPEAPARARPGRVAVTVKPR